MKIQLPNSDTVDQLHHSVDESIAKLKNSAAELENWVRSEAPHLKSVAIDSLAKSRAVTQDAADALVRNAKAHPVVYLLAGIGLATLVTGAILSNSCCNKRR